MANCPLSRFAPAPPMNRGSLNCLPCFSGGGGPLAVEGAKATDSTALQSIAFEFCIYPCTPSRLIGAGLRWRPLRQRRKSTDRVAGCRWQPREAKQRPRRKPRTAGENDHYGRRTWRNLWQSVSQSVSQSVEHKPARLICQARFVKIYNDFFKSAVRPVAEPFPAYRKKTAKSRGAYVPIPETPPPLIANS